MSAFIVTVRLLGRPDHTYRDVATDSAALVMAAQDRFGACGVSVTPV